MKTLFSLLLFFVGYQQVYSQEDLKVQKYSVLKFIGPDTNSKAAAQYTEKTYTLPAYKTAAHAYKQVTRLLKKGRLSKKELKLIESYKVDIHKYQFWLKVTKLYHAAHFSEILQQPNPNEDENSSSSSEDPIDKVAQSIYLKVCKNIWTLFKENNQITEKKDFVHPAKASYSVRLRKPMKGKELPQKLREKLLTVLEGSLQSLN